MANYRPIDFDPKVASLIIREELDKAKELIINHIRANGQNASGRTIKSLHVELPTEEEGILYGHLPFGVLETGRRAGKVPYGFIGIIRQWMRDKGLHGSPIPYTRQGQHKYNAQERGDMSMAAAIARTIARRGSKLHRNGGRADVYSNVIPDTMKRVQQRIIFLIDKSFQTIKINDQ